MDRDKPNTDSDELADAKREGQRSSKKWKPVIRKAFHELESKGWLQNFVIGLAFLLVSQLAVRLFMTGIRGTIIGAAIGLTILFWIFVIVLVRASSDEESSREAHSPAASTPTPATRDDIEDIKRQIADLYRSVKPPTSDITEKYPGLSIQAVLRFHVNQEARRKYLFDFGKANKGRFSIYFDSDNVFTLSLIDSNGEVHAVRIPSGIGGMPVGEFVYLSSEIAIANKSTFLRVLVNGNRVGSLDLPFRLNPGSLDLVGGTVGADLLGNNGAQFDLAEVAIYSTTLTSKETKDLLEYFASKPTNKYIQFSGTQWLRHVGKGIGLSQNISGAKPIFRNLEEQTPVSDATPDKR